MRPCPEDSEAVTENDERWLYAMHHIIGEADMDAVDTQPDRESGDRGDCGVVVSEDCKTFCRAACATHNP